MALKKCKECGKEVSSDAKTCPHCGARLKTSFMAKVLAIVGGFILFSYAMENIHKNDLEYQARAAQEEQVLKERQKAAKAIVKSERKILSADWSYDGHFVAAVLPNGTRHDGYAQYLCKAYFPHMNITVSIIDASKKSYTEIGRANCKSFN